MWKNLPGCRGRPSFPRSLSLTGVAPLHPPVCHLAEHKPRSILRASTGSSQLSECCLCQSLWCSTRVADSGVAWYVVRPGSSLRYCTRPPTRDSHHKRFCAHTRGILSDQTNTGTCAASTETIFVYLCEAPTLTLEHQTPFSHILSIDWLSLCRCTIPYVS